MATAVDQVKRAVDSLFSDTTCSRQVTKGRLEDVKERLELIIEDIKMFLDSLDND